MVLRLRQHNIGYTADGFYRSDDPTNSVKALKEVVSHPDRPQSNHAHLTVLRYYNMHADITQENNIKVNEGNKARLNILRNKIFSLANIGKLSNVSVSFYQ